MKIKEIAYLVFTSKLTKHVSSSNCNYTKVATAVHRRSRTRNELQVTPRVKIARNRIIANSRG